MQILMLSDQYSPDAKSIENEFPWKLAGQFIKQGHNIRMIVPGKGDLSNAEPALALRISPIEIQHQGIEISYTRFDTRTTGGIDVFVLQPKTDTPEAFSADALGAAAATLIGASDFRPEILISWNNALAPSGILIDCPKRIAAFTHVPPNIDASLSQYTQITIHGRALATQLAHRTNTSLATTVTSGKATVVQLGSDAPRMSIMHKESAKASLQHTLGLPVDAQIPLFYISNDNAATSTILEPLLTQHVQIVCAIPTEKKECNALADSYPDRLCVIPKQSNEANLINGADFCILSNRAASIATALCSGTVPIVESEGTAQILELDPAMRSGNGLSLSLDPSAAQTTLRHAVGLFGQKNRFNVLRGRLAGSVATMDHVAETYIPVDNV